MVEKNNRGVKMTEEDKEKYETDHELYSKSIECENCAAEYTITYDYDNQDDPPGVCPFCGNELEEFLFDDMDELKMDVDED